MPDSFSGALRAGPSVIDHQRFPHIIDAIIDVAEPAALFKLRATSKVCLERVDKHLFNHIVVTGSTRCMLATPFGPLPGIPWEDEKATKTERDLWRKRLSYTRVFDCHTTLDIAITDRDLASAVSNLQIIRRFGPSTKGLPAPTVVDFAFLTPQEGSHSHADRSISRPCECPSAFTEDVPEGTRTSVVNVFYDPDRPPLHSFLQLGHCSPNTKSVIIYTARPDPQSGKSISASSPSCLPDTMPPLYMLFHLIEELAIRDDLNQHALVGIDDIQRESLRLPPHIADEDVHRLILDQIQAEASTYLPQSVVKGIPDRISFMSRQAYAIQVGGWSFRLETSL